MMSKEFHMSGCQAYKVIICHLIFLLSSLNGTWAGILIYDGSLGIEEFRDVELSNTEPISRDGIMGAIVAASPIDACTNISRPPNVNISMNWFVLIAGNSCSFEVKVLNARYAGYDVAVIYITETKIPHFIRTNNGYYSYFPNISAVVIGSDQGHRIRDNYLFEIDERFRVYIFPNNSFSIMTFLLLFSIVTGLFLVVMLVFAVIRFFQHSSSVQRGRLSSRHLKQLQTSTYSKGDGSDSCAICLEEYKDQDKLRFLPCSHGYHARCIDPWLTNNRPICPVCKQKVVLEGHNSDNTRDSDLDERSETTPLLQDRRDTQHGTFNLIYNPAGENVGDLNLPSTSVSESVGRVRVLRQSVSSPGGGDSLKSSVTENLSGNNLSKDSGPQNVGIIKRLVFLKKSPKNLDNSDVLNPVTSKNASVSADSVVADLVGTDLPGDSAVINITGVDLSNSVIGDPNVANVGGTILPSDTITGYVAGTNLSEFWPSDHLDKIKLSNESLSRNQDGLNLSSDVSVNLGGTTLSSDTKVNLGDVLSKSVSVGDINLPTESVSVNLDGINLSGESIVGNHGGIIAPSGSVAANFTGVKTSSDLNDTALGDIIGANAPSATNLEAFDAPSVSVATNVGVSVTNEVVPDNFGIDLPGGSVTANLDGSHLISGVSVSANLGGANVSNPSISANLENVNVSSPSRSANLGGINVSSPHISANLGDFNVSSASISAKLEGVNVSSPSISANLQDVNASSPSIRANLGSINVINPSMRTNLRGVNASSPLIAVNRSGIPVSSPSVDSNVRGINVSGPSVSTSLRGTNISSDTAPTNVDISLSSSSAAASPSDTNLSNKPVAANRRRRRNFK